MVGLAQLVERLQGFRLADSVNITKSQIYRNFKKYCNILSKKITASVELKIIGCIELLSVRLKLKLRCFSNYTEFIIGFHKESFLYTLWQYNTIENGQQGCTNFLYMYVKDLYILDQHH